MTTDAHLTDLAGIRREHADRSVAEVRSADSVEAAEHRSTKAEHRSTEAQNGDT